MVNVYVFSESSSLTNWTEIAAGYQNKLVLLGGTALETGGADTHTHTGSVSSVSSVSASNIGGSGLYVLVDSSHTHSGSVNSVGNSSNLPYYRTIRLFYRSVTGWDGKVPAGAIIMRSLAPSNWSLYTCTEFVMAAAGYGTTGGGTHLHAVSGALANYSGSGRNSGVAHNSFTNKIHGHSFSGTISASYDYYYAAIQFIKADQEGFVPLSSYLLFDGDPGPKWAAVTAYDGRYLRFGTGDWSTGGSYISTAHTHTGSITSNGSNACTSYANGSYADYLCSHTHNVTVSLESGTAQPPYVRLLLYQLTTDFSSTLITAYDIDILIKTVNIDSTISTGLLIKKINVSSSINVDFLLRLLNLTETWNASTGLLRHNIDGTYIADTLIKRPNLDRPFYSDLLVQKDFPVTGSFDLFLKKLALSTSFSADLLTQIKGKYTSYDLDLLVKIYNLNRSMEMDLLTQIRNKSVTAAFDLLTQIRNKSASDQMDLLLQFRDLSDAWEVDALVKWVKSTSFSLDLLSKKLGLTSSIDMNFIIKGLSSEDVRLDLLLEKLGLSVPADIDLIIKRVGLTSSEVMGLLLKRENLSTFKTMDLLVHKKNLAKTYDTNLLAKIRNLAATVAVDLLLKAEYLTSINSNTLLQSTEEASVSFDMLQKVTEHKTFTASTALKLTPLALWNASIRIQRFNIAYGYQARTAILKDLNTTYALDLLLIPQRWKVVMIGYRAIKALRLPYLAEALFFGTDTLSFRVGLVISDRPTEHRERRKYPSAQETATGVVEVHREDFSFERIKAQRTCALETETHIDPEIHPDHFDFELVEPKKRSFRSTYR